jgi:hypothetical protein
MLAPGPGDNHDSPRLTSVTLATDIAKVKLGSTLLTVKYLLNCYLPLISIAFLVSACDHDGSTAAPAEQPLTQLDDTAQVWIGHFEPDEHTANIISDVLKSASIRLDVGSGAGRTYLLVRRKDGEKAIKLLKNCEELKGTNITIYRWPSPRGS